MMERKKDLQVVVGYDLGDVTSQISYCLLSEDEPETLSTVAGMEQFNIPTKLCKRKEVNQWFYGKEAEKTPVEEGTLITNIVSLAQREETVTIEETEYKSDELLTLFVKRSLGMLSVICAGTKIAVLVITVDNLNHKMISILNKVVEGLHIKVKEVMFQSREESFFAYMIHQEAALWSHQVLVCDVSDGRLKTFRLEMNRRCVPIVAFIDKKEYPDMDISKVPKTEMAAENFKQEFDRELLQIVKGVCQDRVISSVYLIGDGFAGEWCQESLRFLCKGRRVFQGNNMYSKGACHLAKESINETEIGKGHIFLGNDKLKANIGMKVIRSGEESYFAILDAGQNWYESKKEFDLLLETDNVMELIITPLNGQNIKIAKICLEGMPQRPVKASRIKVIIDLKAENLVSVYIKDMGFGEMYASSGIEWNEEFEII